MLQSCGHPPDALAVVDGDAGDGDVLLVVVL